ncbi:MAG: hypothetical protein KBS81_09810, partial [Spirochaetales bacterium]|nr:hypothetical protein [Candidatus Physcosoma equi]
VLMSGQRAKVVKCTMKSSGKASVQEYMMWISWDDYMNFYNDGKTKAEFNDGRDCGFLTKDAQYAYVFSTEGIHYYQMNPIEQYQEYRMDSLEGRKIGDIRMTPDTEFGYMIDNDTHRLVSMSVKKDTANGGYTLEEGDWIDLPDADLNKIEICQTGNYLAIYSTSGTESITVIKAAR